MAVKGIEKLVQKFAVQTAIYWKNNGPDGFGGYNFDAPIEIKCRWDGKSEIKMTNTGQYYASAASLMTNQEVNVDDYVCLGFLSGFSGQDISNPKAVNGAFAIIQVDKIPMVKKTDEFVRTAYLFDYAK
jgi:hypothetical protein